jgi:hypothetical protein
MTTAKNEEKSVNDKVLEYISARARTDREVESKFGKDGVAELHALAKKPPEGYRVRKAKNSRQEATTLLEEIVSNREVKVQPRVWDKRVSENDPDYLAIIFPVKLDFTDDQKKNSLKIFPIDESLFGGHTCDEDRLSEYLGWLKRKDYAFAFLNGCNIGGSGYDKETAVHIRDRFMRLLAPVAHKVLWAQSGPLEERMSRIDGIDPLRVVCQELGIHHADRPVRADVYWKDPTRPIEFSAVHGASTARDPGAIANAIIGWAVSENFPHFAVKGHLKHGMTITLTARRLRPDRFEIVEHPSCVVSCPGFEKYQGSVLERKGYPPPALGTVACRIKSDNGHEASS